MRLKTFALAFLAIAGCAALTSELAYSLDRGGPLSIVTALLLDLAGWLAVIAAAIGGRLLGRPAYHSYMSWLLGCGVLWTACCTSNMPSLPWPAAAAFVGLLTFVPLVVFGEVCPWMLLGREIPDDTAWQGAVAVGLPGGGEASQSPVTEPKVAETEVAEGVAEAEVPEPLGDRDLVTSSDQGSKDVGQFAVERADRF